MSNIEEIIEALRKGYRFETPPIITSVTISNDGRLWINGQPVKEWIHEDGVTVEWMEDSKNPRVGTLRVEYIIFGDSTIVTDLRDPKEDAS